MQVQTNRISIISTRGDELLTLKNLLRNEQDPMNIFLVDDEARAQDMTSLPNDEVCRRLSLFFSMPVNESHLRMPLIALMDYLFP